MRSKIFPLFFALAMTAPAQIVSFGVKGGVPVSLAPFTDLKLHQEKRYWTAGATVEFHVTKSLSIEVDALYRAYNLTGQGSVTTLPDQGSLTYALRNQVKAWDFPLLLKYRFLRDRPVRPFIDGGLSFTHESADLTSSCFGPGCFSAGVYVPQAGTSTVQANRKGQVAGGGVEFRYGKLAIAPELRYTRIDSPGGNQVSLLVGLTF